MKFQFLNNNALKIIACISMLLDHMGYLLFPKVLIFRILGRIAFPIFTYMIAEGCYYTRNKTKHLILMLTAAILMQIGLYVGTGFFGEPDTRFSIILLYAISVILIYLYDVAEKFFKDKEYFYFVMTSLLLISLIAILHVLTFKGHILYDYCYANYNFTAIIAPLILYIIKKYLPSCWWLSIIVLGLMLVGKASVTTLRVNNGALNVAWLMPIGLIPLIFYNGKKGKLNLKYLFYLFYPIHMIILYFISSLL